MSGWPGWRVMSLRDLRDPDAREFFVGDDDWPFRGFVIRLDGRLFAYANVCPHKRHPLNLDDDHFLVPGERLVRCASHHALFEPETGLCLAGPCAGRALKSLECWLEGEDVMVRAPASLRDPGAMAMT